MSTSASGMKKLEERVTRLSVRKSFWLATLALLFPFYFVLTSDHFSPSEWGEMFWVVGAILWLVGFLVACTLYFGLTYLLYVFGVHDRDSV